MLMLTMKLYDHVKVQADVEECRRHVDVNV
jgi:hypothetical protein